MPTDLFGNPIERKPKANANQIVPFDFETQAVRVVMRDGQPWWVASDVCRVLGLNTGARNIREQLDADDIRSAAEGCDTTDVIKGIRCDALLVSEPGVYQLIFASRKPEAKRFKRWIAHEVLPALRRTGTYTLPRAATDRVEQTQRRLGCDPKTAKARCEQADTNKKIHIRMASEKATRNRYRANHNAAYRGEFDGLEARDLRERGGYDDSPLNHMESVPLSINTHAKTLAERYIAANNIPLPEQPAVYERFARDVTRTGLSILGGDHVLGFREHPQRGRVIDAIDVRQLTSA